VAISTSGLDVIELRTDRSMNVELHLQVFDEALAAVRAQLEGVRYRGLVDGADRDRWAAPPRRAAGERSGGGLLHGFTGSTATWVSLMELLAPHCEVIEIDIVGHVQSDAPTEVDRYRMDRCSDDRVSVIAALGHERAIWIGYSMGARTVLQIAVRHPRAVDALVLEGVTSGFPDAAESAVRVESDERLAERIREERLEAFVDFWQSIGLWDTQASMPKEKLAVLREQRLQSDPVGLANCLQGMGTGA